MIVHHRNYVTLEADVMYAKRFIHCVVEAIAGGTHRRPHPGLLAVLAESERGILGGFKRSSQSLDREELR
jgi:hypothetical protein